MKKLIPAALFFFLFSCGGDKEKVPDSVLPKDKMVNIMKDIHMAEAELSVNSSNIINNPLADTISYTDIFSKNKIQKWQYDSSMMYYSLHPEILNEIYDEVINELEKNKKETEQGK